jgi:heme exporter protein D
MVVAEAGCASRRLASERRALLSGGQRLARREQRPDDNPMIETLTVLLVVFAALSFLVALIALVVLIVDLVNRKK